MHQEGHKQEEELEEASQSYSPEVRYKHRTALCNKDVYVYYYYFFGGGGAGWGGGVRATFHGSCF